MVVVGFRNITHVKPLAWCLAHSACSIDDRYPPQSEASWLAAKSIEKPARSPEVKSSLPNTVCMTLTKRTSVLLTR